MGFKRIFTDRMITSIVSFMLLLTASESTSLRSDDSFKECPYPELLTPHCNCKEFGRFAMMACTKITNSEDLIAPIKATHGYDIMSIVITDSTFNYIPKGIFKNTSFTKIRFYNTQVLSLSDTDVAFEGLENHLEEIRATGAFYVTSWDWNMLRNHKRLDVIDVDNIAMHAIENEFPSMDSLTALGIHKCDISFVHPFAFRRLNNLKLLILKDNEISQMKRSMLPIPAFKLHHLDLSNNSLSHLPFDMFSYMPNLKEVLLSLNKFKVINEETFSPIFKQAQMLLLDENDIRCDCRLKWIVNHPVPMYFEGRCKKPQSLQGTSLRYLNGISLTCSHEKKF